MDAGGQSAKVPAERQGGGDLLFQDLFDDTPEAAALSQGEVVVFRRRNNPERYDFVTPGIELLTGFPAREFTPALWDGMVQEVRLRGELAGLSHDAARARYLRGEVSRWHGECRVRHRDGSTRWILDLSVPLRGADGSVAGSFGFLHDITAQRTPSVAGPTGEESALQTAQDRLLQREAYERALLQAVPDLLAVVDTDGNYLDFKPETNGQDRYTAEQVIGRNMRDFPFHEEDRTRVLAALRTAVASGTVQLVDYRFLRNGEPVWWEARIARLDSARVIVLATDVDERKRAEDDRRRIEEQMRNAQQLESLGVLAGGIAHDFNNLLVGIMGNADLALKELPEGHTRDCIADLRNASARAAELTNLMLAYAGRGTFQTAAMDINIVALEVSQLIQAAVSKKVTLHFELDRTIACVKGDAAQLRQVVMNLIVNAAEAYGENEGEVVIRTGRAEITATDLPTLLPAGSVRPGGYIFLEVRDHGTGMDENTCRRIFEPFFTTKFTGRGLGLSASLGILRSHEGCIHVASGPGAGSVFTIFLPPATVPEPQPAHDTALDLTRKPAPPPATTTGRVLVVDDEDVVRRVVRRQLERVGFTVLTEADGRQAVQLIAEQPDLIDLVLLDLTMPGMGGEEVLIYLRSIGFKHPVVLMSGYDESEASAIARRLGVFAFIRKPFQLDHLVNTLRAAIAEHRTRSRTVPDSDQTIAEDRG